MPPALPPLKTVPALFLAVGVALVAFGGMRLFLELSTPIARPVAASHHPPSGPPSAFLKTWCYDCHGDGAAKGGLDLQAALTPSDWQKMERHVLLHTMPPPSKGEAAPDHSERVAFSDGLRRFLATLPPDSRPAPLRRLSRAEYNRSARALLGTDSRPADAFPDDETAHGFDNNGDMQPLPASLMERYLNAAENLAREALVTPAPLSRVLTVTADQFTGGDRPVDESPDWRWVVEAGNPATARFDIPEEGAYRYTVTARAHQAGDTPVLLRLTPGGEHSVPAISARTPDKLSGTIRLPRGAATLTLALANPFSDPGAEDPHRRERHLLISKVELEGPLDAATRPGPMFAKWFPHTPDAAELARSAADFAEKAWRRPLSPAETARFASLTGRASAAGLPPHEVAALAVSTALVSPGFLFLTDPAEVAGSARDFAVASRLSYFLTGGPPDEPLLKAAAAGWSPKTLRAQALRLLSSPGAVSLADDFAGQWLRLRNTALVRPDKNLFPEADPSLLADMTEESRLFLLNLIRENAPVLRLADADWTFVNPRLARHYGLPEPDSEGFHRVPLTGTRRRGIVTQGAVLTLTSYPNRTSPVLRGRWVLEALLGLEPPPAPPNVPTLEVAPRGGGHHTESVREALERHRADKACASCHAAIDPPGFALEGFDAIGRERATAPGETETTVFTGDTLRGSGDLARWLASEQQGTRIVRNAAERLFTFALARGLSPAETLHAAAVADSLGGRDARFRDLILAVVLSPVFRGDAPPPSP